MRSPLWFPIYSCPPVFLLTSYRHPGELIMTLIIIEISIFLVSLVLILFWELRPLRHPSRRRSLKSSLLRILEDLTSVLFILAFISVFLAWRVSVIRTQSAAPDLTPMPSAATQAPDPTEFPKSVTTPAPEPSPTVTPAPAPSLVVPSRVVPESSELISLLEYAPSSQILTVTDKEGNVTHYKDIPETIWNDFSNSGSIDGYYLRIIKEKYTSE